MYTAPAQEGSNNQLFLNSILSQMLALAFRVTSQTSLSDYFEFRSKFGTPMKLTTSKLGQLTLHVTCHSRSQQPIYVGSITAPANRNATGVATHGTPPRGVKPVSSELGYRDPGRYHTSRGPRDTRRTFINTSSTYTKDSSPPFDSPGNHVQQSRRPHMRQRLRRPLRRRVAIPLWHRLQDARAQVRPAG